MDPVKTPPNSTPDLSETSSATTEELFVQIDPEEIGLPDEYGSRALIIDETGRDDNNALAKDSVDPLETPRTAKNQPPFTVNFPKKAAAETTTNVCTEPTQKSCLDCMLKTYAAQTAGRSQQIREEIVAITDLQNNSVSFSIINAPREHLRSFLRKRIGYPRPVGNNNFLNVLFGDGKTFLHGSVLNKKYDITELLLFNLADVNIKEDSRTILHRAAVLNDTILCKIAILYSADLTQFNEIGETPMLVAIAFSSPDVLAILWRNTTEHQLSANGETTLHYAARYNNEKVTKFACESQNGIDVTQTSTHEQRTALHVAILESRVEIVKILLANGAVDDVADSTGHFAYEYITDGEIKDPFVHHKMRIETTVTIKIGKRKRSPEDTIPVLKRLTTQIERSNNPLLRDMLFEEQKQTSTQPLRREIERLALYDPNDGKTNTYMYLVSVGFAREILITDFLPIEPPVPCNYQRPDFQGRAPKIVYPINNPREYQLHITLLKPAYSRRVVFCNRTCYKRDLYEVYLWERNNITRSLQAYRQSCLTLPIGQRAAEPKFITNIFKKKE
jgi:hypothetical protein